jgi:predicted nucleotidyltransferase component of viral defense system
MLHTETVDPGTFTLLKELLSLNEFSTFSLVGGTALSLKFGHRKSVDLDLFSVDSYDHNEMLNCISSHFGNRLSIHRSREGFGIFCSIDNVKIDIIHYPFPLISELDVQDDIRMYSNQDIAAMKVQAVLGRAVKKDFWDISELLNHFEVSDLIQFHSSKYPNQMLAIAVHSALLYFAEAETSPEPEALNNLTWQEIKESIRLKVDSYLKT